MQARTLLPCLFALSVIITGCPESTKIPLSPKSTADQFDKALLGTWLNNEEKVAANEVLVSPGYVKNTYAIKVTKKGSSFFADSDSFTGWITTFKKEKFLVLQEVYLGTHKNDFYLYQFELKDNRLSTQYLNMETVADAPLESSGDYQNLVTKLMKNKRYLKGEINWKKK